MNRDEKLFSIGEVAKMFHVSGTVADIKLTIKP